MNLYTLIIFLLSVLLFILSMKRELNLNFIIRIYRHVIDFSFKYSCCNDSVKIYCNVDNYKITYNDECDNNDCKGKIYELKDEINNLNNKIIDQENIIRDNEEWCDTSSFTSNELYKTPNKNRLNEEIITPGAPIKLTKSENVVSESDESCEIYPLFSDIIDY